MAQHVMRELMKALKEYGRTSPYFLGMLEGQLTGSVVVPQDVKYLFRCLHSRTEYQLWEANWKRHLQDALPSLLSEPNTSTDHEGNPITLRHLMGEGDWELPNKQASEIPRPVLSRIAVLAVKAFTSMRPTGPVESYLDIFQGPQENFLQFVERLTIAVEQQEEDEMARERLVTALAFKHANAVCKQAMLTLPRNPKPTLQDFIEVVADIAPLMVPAKPERPERQDPRKKIHAAFTAEHQPPSAGQRTARTPRFQRKPSKGAADGQCALCGRGGHWWKNCPLRDEFQQFKREREGGQRESAGNSGFSQQKN